MADPIKHDTGSGLVTAGWESLKGVGTGFAAVIGGMAAAGAAVGVLLAVLSPVGIGLGAVAGAGVVGGLLGGVAGLAVSAAGAGPIAAFGGLLGLARGGKRISRENAAARTRLERLSETQAMHDAAVGQMAVEQAAPLIAQQVQQQTVAAMQQQMAQQEMAAASKLNPENFKKAAGTSHLQAAIDSKAPSSATPER